jgi:hypothetical protein
MKIRTTGKMFLRKSTLKSVQTKTESSANCSNHYSALPSYLKLNTVGLSGDVNAVSYYADLTEEGQLVLR